jgi:hypothetical protein
MIDFMKLAAVALAVALLLSGCGRFMAWRVEQSKYHNRCTWVCPAGWNVFYDGGITCTCMDPAKRGDMYQVPAPPA